MRPGRATVMHGSRGLPASTNLPQSPLPLDRSEHEDQRFALAIPVPHFGIPHLDIWQRQVLRAAGPRLACELDHEILRGVQDRQANPGNKLTLIARLLEQRLNTRNHPGVQHIRLEELDAPVVRLDLCLEAIRERGIQRGDESFSQLVPRCSHHGNRPRAGVVPVAATVDGATPRLPVANARACTIGRGPTRSSLSARRTEQRIPAAGCRRRHRDSKLRGQRRQRTPLGRLRLGSAGEDGRDLGQRRSRVGLARDAHGRRSAGPVARHGRRDVPLGASSMRDCERGVRRLAAARCWAAASRPGHIGMM